MINEKRRKSRNDREREGRKKGNCGGERTEKREVQQAGERRMQIVSGESEEGRERKKEE